MPPKVTELEDRADSGTGGSGQEKDSGISRITDSEPEPVVGECCSMSPSPYAISPPIVSRVGLRSKPPSFKRNSSGGSASNDNERTGFITGNELSTSPRKSAGSLLTLSPECMSTTPSEAQAPSKRQFGYRNHQDNIAGNGTLYRSESEGSLACELAKLNREMQHIQMECDRLVDRYAKQELRVRHQVAQAHQLVSNLDSRLGASLAYWDNQTTSQQPANAHCVMRSPVSQRNLKLKDDTSSAYNTGGESCRSTPLHGRMELSPRHHKLASVPGQKLRRDAASYQLHHPSYPFQLEESTAIPPPVPRHQHKATLAKASSSVTLHPSHMTKRSRSVDKHQGCMQAPSMLRGKPMAAVQGQPHSAFSVNALNVVPHAPSLSDISTPTVYTQAENLDLAILIQQRMFRQAMLEQAKLLKTHNEGHYQGPMPASQLYGSLPTQQAGSQDSNEKVEWKVKRRSDGSRYVTRRPVRNKLLRDRAEKLSNERQGLTTDDDAASELKVGRYWSKMERKRQFERARQRKKLQEVALKRRAQQLSSEHVEQNDIVELSNKKMARKKNQQLFDKFTTIQEYLAHGTREVDNGKKLGILSVTTV